jgi:carbamoylphosphate synthase large subunit
VRILVLGAGGAAANGFCRALRMAGEYHLIGANINADDLELAETDERHLIDLTDESLWQLCWRTKPDFAHAQPDEEVVRLGRMRNALRVSTFLPYPWVISTCQDKWETYKVLREAGVPVPRTQLVRGPHDVMAHGDQWLRATNGAGGAGAIRTDRVQFALEWMIRCDGWGKFTTAEVLTEQTVTVQQVWWRGQLIASQQRSRASWANAKNSPSGVSGSTGVGVTTSDALADTIADKAVQAVAEKPHGLFGVDMARDNEGIPRVTEINIGRFFTTAPEFFARAGFNMAYVYVKWGTGDPFWVNSTPWRNPIRDGRRFIRGMDKEPVLLEA